MEQPMPQEAPAPEAGGADEGMKAIQTLGNGLSSLAEGIMSSGMPDEAKEAIAQAQEAYGRFIEIVTGGGAPANSGNQPVDAMGSKGAVPADQPQGPGKMIPA